MPLIKSAIKKMRSDEVRTARNQAAVNQLKTVLKNARSAKKYDAVSEAYSALDRAVKKNLIHRNFAARQKAQLSKLAKPVKLEARVKPVKKVAKKLSPAARKSPAKKPVKKSSK